MEFDTAYHRQWVTGTVAARELRHRIPRIIFGYRCGMRTITRMTNERDFDSRKSDTIPRRFMKSATAAYHGTFALTRVYIYPGEEFEVPGFDHAIGRRQLRSAQTLMATIVPSGVSAMSLPMSQVTTMFDQALAEPYVEISYIVRKEFMVYDGPQGLAAKLHFRDRAEQRAYCYEFPSDAALPEALTAA